MNHPSNTTWSHPVLAGAGVLSLSYAGAGFQQKHQRLLNGASTPATKPWPSPPGRTQHIELYVHAKLAWFCSATVAWFYSAVDSREDIQRSLANQPPNFG
jgi:hypothetical protein